MEPKSSAIDRRKFLSSLAVVSAIPFIPGCKESLSSDNDKYPDADIFLTGDENNIAFVVKQQYNKLQSLQDNLDRELIIEYNVGRREHLLSLSFVENEAASYKHLLIKNFNNGETINAVWGMEGIYPSIKFTDNNGSVLNLNGIKMEFALKPGDNETSSPKDWLALGIKIFAVALAVWLGASVAKFIIAAIAFLAFNAMVIGLVLIGLSLLLPLLKLILSLTGWSLSTVTELFKLSAELLLALLLEIQTFILNYKG